MLSPSSSTIIGTSGLYVLHCTHPAAPHRPGRINRCSIRPEPTSESPPTVTPDKPLPPPGDRSSLNTLINPITNDPDQKSDLLNDYLTFSEFDLFATGMRLRVVVDIYAPTSSFLRPWGMGPRGAASGRMRMRFVGYACPGAAGDKEWRVCWPVPTGGASLATWAVMSGSGRG